MTNRNSTNASEVRTSSCTNRSKCCENLCGQIDKVIQAVKFCYYREHTSDDAECDMDTFFDQTARSLHGTVRDYFKSECIKERVIVRPAAQ